MKGCRFIVQRDITYLLKTAFYDRVCQSLKDQKNVRELFSYISNFRNKNINTLSSPYITNIIVFNTVGEDANVVFRCCGVEREEVDKVLAEALIKLKLDKTGNSKDSQATNVTSLRAILIMAMAYFYSDKEKMKILALYYAYSIYYSVFTLFFGSSDRINKECMEYTVNEMTNKFVLKRVGSLDELLYYTMNVAIEKYTDRYKRLADIDIVDQIMAFKTRISHAFRNIRGEYNKNYNKGGRIFESIEKNAEGEYIMDRENNLMLVDGLASKYATKFFQTDINVKNVNLASNICDASRNEIKSAIDLLRKEGDSREVKEFYQCLFYLFFTANPKATARDINSTKFLASADAIYKKGNSNDKNILRIKALSHKWLKTGSNTYRSTTRVPTINNFRKAIFMYFVLSVSTGN